MIDVHCHLEQPDYKVDRDAVVLRCKQQLDAVITSCVSPEHLDSSLLLVTRHSGFVFASASLHPAYVKTVTPQMCDLYVERLRLNQDSLVAIGETGLDYNWVKNDDWRKKQQQLFSKMIDLSVELQLPLVIHSRDAIADTLELLEERSIPQVHMHMLTKHAFLKRILDNGWFISVNTLLLRSKEIRKIVRDCPLEFLMLETDSPWLGLNEDGAIRSKYEVRNEPISVKLVAQRVAEIKKVSIDEVNQITTNNANSFFNLGLKSLSFS